MTPQPSLRLAKTPPDPIQAHPASSTQLSMHHLPFIKALEPFIISDSISNFCQQKVDSQGRFLSLLPLTLILHHFVSHHFHLKSMDGIVITSMLFQFWCKASYISHFSKPPSQWDGNLTWLLVNLNNVGGTWLFVSVPAMKWCLFSLKKKN